jgi:protein SCO1
VKTSTAAALVALLVATLAKGAVDPGAATAPRTDFAVPIAGTYQLQEIQSTADAELLDTSGRVQHLSRFTRGKVTLLTFFYTSCPDPLGCPFGYVTLSQLRSRVLADAGLTSAVRFVNVSLDPVNDTPAAVRRYAAHFGTDPRFEWSFLTAASISQLLPVLDDFGQDVSVELDSRGHATRVLHHMLKVFLIDPRGMVREIYSLAYLQPDVMLSDIRTLAMETSSVASRQRVRVSERYNGNCIKQCRSELAPAVEEPPLVIQQGNGVRRGGAMGKQPVTPDLIKLDLGRIQRE